MRNQPPAKSEAGCYKEIKQVSQSQSPVKSESEFVSRTRKEATYAAWLTGGKQAAKRSKQVLLKAFKVADKRLPAPIAKWVHAQLDTDLGLAVYAIVLGNLLGAVPAMANDPVRSRLLGAMRTWGMHVATDSIVDPVLDLLVAAFDDVAATLSSVDVEE